MTKHTETLTRKELYDLVWSNSLVALSKKYCVSDYKVVRPNEHPITD